MMERDPLALAMLAAWLNVPVDKLPPEMRAHTCKSTMEAWQRVGAAATAHVIRSQPAPVVDEADHHELCRAATRAALCLSGWASSGFYMDGFEDPADVFCDLTRALGVPDADDDDLRAALNGGAA